MRIEQLKERYDVEVSWVHFPLHPETPPEGQSLEDLFADRDFDLEAMKGRLMQLAQEQGLPYGDRSMTYNSRLAQELGKWADGQEGGEAIHDALFRAYFVDGVNIGKIEALLEIAAQIGLDVDQARKALETRSFKDSVDRDWQRSRELAITGVPTFVAGGYGAVGAQPYETLEALAVKAGAKKRADRST